MAAKKPRVLILTSLTDFDRAYSIATVALDQCRMLHMYDYPYAMSVLENFNEEYKDAIKTEKLNIRYNLPQTFLHTYGETEKPKEDGEVKTSDGRPVPGFEKQVTVHADGYVKEIEKFKPDVVITHDLMFQAGHLTQNAAVRKCIERFKDIRWLHWVHSAPSYQPANTCYPSTLRFRGAPRSKFVYLNQTDLQNYGCMINESTENLHVVYNSRDIRASLGMAPETWVLCDRYRLLESDIVQTYAFSAGRWRAKGVEELICMFGHFKRMQLKPKLVLCTAHTNTPKIDDKYLREIEGAATYHGLDIDDDVIITSRFADEMIAVAREQQNVDEIQRWQRWRYSVPQRIVRDLFHLSDLFIFPSQSENCSLIQAEAAIAGNYMVLNRNFAPMLEFAPRNVLTYEFSINRVRPDPPKVPKANPVYYEHVARELFIELQKSRLYHSRRYAMRAYSFDWVFKKQLEPLLWLGHKVIEEEEKKKLVPTKHARPVPAETDAKGSTTEPGGEKKMAPVLTPPKSVTPDTPYDGMPCSIFGECTPSQREECMHQGGHCLLKDTFVEENQN